MSSRISTLPDLIANGTPPDAVENQMSTNIPRNDTPPDPFDPASLRLTGDMTAALGVKKVLLTVPTRKPDKTWWVRVHPNTEYHITTAVIELKEDRETYLVPQPANDLAQNLRRFP